MDNKVIEKAKIVQISNAIYFALRENNPDLLAPVEHLLSEVSSLSLESQGELYTEVQNTLAKINKSLEELNINKNICESVLSKISNEGKLFGEVS